MWKTNFTALAAVALLVSVPYLLSNAADDAPATTKAPASATKAPAAPAAEASYSSASDDLYDPAFSRYIDLGMLGHAWDTLDASLLTDCALLLAEGERALYRSHKAITSDQLLELAAKTAAEKKDTKALDRLAKVAEGTKNTAALEKITASRKLAGVSRKTDPTLSVSATETSPDQLALYQEALNGMRAASILGDQAYFADLEEGLNNKDSVLVTLSSQQREHLKKIMGQARETMPKEGDQPLTDTLAKLKSASRGDIFRGVSGILNGIHEIAHDHHGHGGGHSWNGGGHNWNGGGGHWNGGGHNWNGGGGNWNGGGGHWNHGGGHNWNGGGHNWIGGHSGTWNGSGGNWNRGGHSWNGGGHSWNGGGWSGGGWNRGGHSWSRP